MFNKSLILGGLAVFVLLVTTPFWYGLLKAGPPPTPEPPPNGASVCVAPVEYMRSSHMKLLDVWRDEVIRESKRETIVVNDPKLDTLEFGKGLQLACMDCHSNKEKFCDSCHEYVSARPDCWTCHMTPAEIASKEAL
jgi:hypothetical protein